MQIVLSNKRSKLLTSLRCTRTVRDNKVGENAYHLVIIDGAFLDGETGDNWVHPYIIIGVFGGELTSGL